MLRSVSTLEYCPVDSTVFLVSPFDIRRPIRNQMVAPRLGHSLQISNERRLRTHTHKDPLTALAIGVSSSVDLSVGEQERAETAPQKRKKKRATLSKWVELREECAALCQYS